MAAFRKVFADTTPLQTPAFRRLWQAGIVTIIGAQLTVFAVPAQIYAITQDSGMVGLAGLFGLVPLVVFGLWGGALADHFDRRKLLMMTTTGLIVTSGIFWIQAALELNNVWLLLGVFALQQAFFAINSPTRQAVLPRILPEEQLPAANALSMTVTAAGGIAGPVVGAALLPALGFSWLYLVDTVTLTATFYAVIKLPALPVLNRQGSPGLKSVVEGIKYLSWHKILLVSFLVDIIAMIFGMPRALFPEMAHVTFGGPVSGGMELGLLNVGLGVGAVLGGLFSGWVSRIRRQGIAVIACVLCWGAAMAAMGVAVELARIWVLAMLIAAFAALVVGGAADMASAAFRQAILLSAADDSVRGRLQGVFIVVVVGGPRIADVLHGYASTLFGPAWTTLGGGLLVIVLTLLVAWLIPQFTRYQVAPQASEPTAPTGEPK
ncbi:MAG: MFS transporter [Propionibacteriaceae bacterium]|nr:MFS transporter [Propionibacteriaceae bacterium]